MEGIREGKVYFPLLKPAKRQKAPLGRSVSSKLSPIVALLRWMHDTEEIIKRKGTKTNEAQL